LPIVCNGSRAERGEPLARILGREEAIIHCGDGRRAVIVGVGIDLIEQERVARALDRWGERLVA
jgi:hypothetical protein